ncbi:MAG: DUF4157 domain-containing protein, partial [Lewinella sp.]
MKVAADHSTHSVTRAHRQPDSTPFFSTVQEKPFFQPKLKVGAPNDTYEQEADSVADRVVQRLAQQGAGGGAQAMSGSSTRGEGIAGNGGGHSGPTVQAKAVPSVAAIVPISRIQRSPEPEMQEEPERENQELQLQRKPIFESGTDDGEVQRKCAACAAEEEGHVRRYPLVASSVPVAQRKCAHCEAEEVLQPKPIADLQRSGNGGFTASDDFSSKLHSTKGGGSPLPADTQRSMGQSMGADFSGVRVHTGSYASGLSNQIGAQAFTHGSDVYFNSGKYDPGSAGGQRLLVHELTHTVQQGAAARKKPDPIVQRTCRECEEGDKIINLRPMPGLQRAVDVRDESGLRKRIIAIAEGEKGLAAANKTESDGRRVGADRLLDYFHLAAPEQWPDEVVEYNRSGFPSWCAIFAVFSIKKAGIDVGNWKMGKGVSEYNSLDATDNPQPGDIGYIDQPWQHHSIIKEVRGDTIISIDGNSGPHSEVLEKELPRDVYTGFLTAFTGRQQYIQKKEEGETAGTRTPDVQRACPPDCASDEEYNIILTAYFEGELLEYDLQVDQATFEEMQARPDAYQEAEFGIEESFYPGNTPIYETPTFLTAGRVKTRIKRDLSEWLAGTAPQPSFRHLNEFIDGRQSLIAENAVLFQYESFLDSQGEYFPGDVDWNVIVPQLLQRSAQWVAPNILEASDYDRYDFFLRVVADEVAGEEPVPGAVTVELEDFETLTYQYVLEHFNLEDVTAETQEIHSDRFLREWLGYIEGIAYIPENFLIEEFTVDEDLEEEVEVQRESLLSDFIENQVPDLVIMFALDEWAESGLSPEEWLADFELSEYREELLDHLTEEFLALARLNEDYADALMALGVARTRIDIIRNIYFLAAANERYNDGLRELFEQTAIADLDEGLLAIATDPYTYHEHSLAIAAAVYALLEAVTPYGPIEDDLLEFGEELLASVDASPEMAGILLFFELLALME